MKILVVHQYYLAPGQPGGSRFNEFARLWSDAGHEVTVITSAVSYASGTAPPEYRGRWITHERDGAVKVLRCWVPETYQKGHSGRALGYLGFVASASTAAFTVDRPDVVIATSPPLTAAFPGWLAARLPWRRVPWVFEIRDLWPESMVTSGLLPEKGLSTEALYLVERWACAWSSKINVLTPAFREDLLKRGLAPDAKIVFVPNGADVEMFKPGPRDNAVRREWGWGDRFVAMYAGAHGKVNALDQLIGAAELLTDRKDILVACVGEGSERQRLTQEAERRGLTNIAFHGPVPKDRMPDVINACDAGVAVLHNNRMLRTVYPNKVFDYMACERPTVLGIDGVARKLVCDDAGAGVFAEPENPREIADAIVRLAGDPDGCRAMGQSGRAWVLANATRESLAKRYLDILQDLVR